MTTRDHRGDKWVYYGSDGAMLHGEGKVSGYWYFFDDGTSKSNGRVTYGWKNLGSKIVYYSWPEGKMPVWGAEDWRCLVLPESDEPALVRQAGSI